MESMLIAGKISFNESHVYTPRMICFVERQLAPLDFIRFLEYWELAQGWDRCFSFPVDHQRSTRTTGGVERLHREVRHHARVVSISPNQALCMRPVPAVLAEIGDELLVGRSFWTF